MVVVHNPIHIRIGQNLHRLRKQRGLSLDKTAELTDVSKGMLHQIERGDTQPTITTLWKIATGLNTSFSALLKVDEAAISVVKRSAAPHVTEDNGRCRVYMLFPFDPQTRIEMFTIVLDASGSYQSPPHNDNVQEYIVAVKGTFQMQVRDEVYVLEEGSAIRFAANVPHRYSNPTETAITIQVTMYYADEE